MALDKTCHVIVIYISKDGKWQIIDGNIGGILNVFFHCISFFNLITYKKFCSWTKQNTY